MRIAIIGCGSIGSRHVSNLLVMGERAIGVFDYDVATQKRLLAERQVTVYATLQDLWSAKPDCVLICTPPDSHLRLAAEARLHGVRGIFIEKPLALSRVIGAEVMEDCVTMVGCNWRWHPGPVTIKRWLEAGVIGDVLSARIVMGYHLPDIRADYKTCYAATTGAVLDVGSHAIDLALWLFGSAKLKAVSIKPATSIGLECDGLAELLLAHASGAVSSLRASFVDGERRMYIIVNGTKGTAHWHQADSQDEVFLYQNGALIKYDTRLEQKANRPYQEEFAHFLECVCKGKQTDNPVSKATAVLNLLLEAKACA